jgi:hypothetical protein
LKSVPFLRFASISRNAQSGVEVGLFQIAYAIRDNPATSEADQRAIRRQLAWFSKHLPAPTRFNRSRSKGYYRRNAKGISWFKDTASECLARMHALKRLAEEHGYAVNVIREDRIGYIVYEDDCQAVAEPYSETRTK